MNILRAGPHHISLDRPLIMGIVNVTPDSFFDGGKFLSRDAAIAHALKLVEEGADIIDVGGESTRPGAASAALQDELDRIMPVVESLSRSGVVVSVDTQKAHVMRAAIEAGAAMINDVNALRADGALEICATGNVAVCLMHMQGEPRTMQQEPQYQDVVTEVESFLLARAHVCEVAGMTHDRIVIDPGFGFGKMLEHNLALLRSLSRLAAHGYPLVAGFSRKSMFKQLLSREIHDRLVPSIVSAMLAVQRGASILRVHDVRDTKDALRLVAAVS